MDRRTNQPVGKTKDVGWQIGARRTLPIRHTDAWKLLTSAEGIAIWLGADLGLNFTEGASYQLPNGTSGQIRVFKPDSHLRLTWHPPGWQRPSTMQIRVLPDGDRTAIAFHQEHLPGPEAREERRAFFIAALDKLEALIASG